MAGSFQLGTSQNQTQSMKGIKKSVSPLTQKLVRIFNTFIRMRDKGKPCISCGAFTDLQAGHFFSAGHYTHLRFNEDNVWGQCVRCNYHLHGNQAEYRIGLIKRIGEEKVKQLEIKAQLRSVNRYSRFELELLCNYYKEKIKSLGKGIR